MTIRKLDLTVVILTYNEEIHIRRCLENICPIAKKVIVVDSPSNDHTVEICKEYSNVEVFVHKYPGNQAAQFNWAIDNLQIDTEWILRIDADEYLLPELIEELQNKVPTLPEDVTGIELKRRHIFMDKWVKHGIYPVLILRMFRTGCGRYDNRMMDEHIVLSKGRTIVSENDFCDHSLISIDEYCKKHLNYARREAAEVLDEIYEISSISDERLAINDGLGKQAQEKHKKKGTYNKLPLFWRSFVYFCFRYFLKGGFLDGKPGFVFAFVQGWWYRTMVDVNVYNAIKECGDDKEKLKVYIKDKFGIGL